MALAIAKVEPVLLRQGAVACRWPACRSRAGRLMASGPCMQLRTRTHLMIAAKCAVIAPRFAFCYVHIENPDAMWPGV